MRVQAFMMAIALASQARAEKLDVDAAVARAAEKSPMLAALRERLAAAGDISRAAAAQQLPSVGVQEELQVYNSDFAVQFTIPGAPVSPSFTARDQVTNVLAVGARQPLVGLFRIREEMAASEKGREAVASQLVAAERMLSEQVRTGYLRLFEARAAREVAKASQAQLSEQVAMAKARVEAGAATSADVLRVEVARANVEQQEIQASVQESGARTLLSTLLELVPGDATEFVDPLATGASEASVGQAPALEEAVSTANQARAELVTATRAAEGAEAQARAKFWALVPEVDAEAAYVNIQGQAFAQKNSGYVGLKASWPIWTWGAQNAARTAAEHQAAAARLAVDETHRMVRTEVSGRLDQLSAATSAIGVAKKALESADEAFRVTQELVRAGSGTTTDLLDAQAALTQARLNLVRSRYQQAIARVQLDHAMGR